MAFMNAFSRLSNFHFILEHCKVGKNCSFGHLFFTVFEESRCPKLEGIRKETFGNSSEDKTRNDTKNWDFCLLWHHCVKLSYQSSGSLKFHTFFAVVFAFSSLYRKTFTVQTLLQNFLFTFFVVTHILKMRLVLLTWWWKFAQLICSKTRKERLRKQIKRRKNSSCCTLQILLSDNNANFNGHKTANYTDYQSLDFCFLKKSIFFCSTYISKISKWLSFQLWTSK